MRESTMNVIKRFLDVILYSALAIAMMTILASVIYVYELYKNTLLVMLLLCLAMYIPITSVLIVNFFITKRKLSELGIKFGRISLFLIIISILYPFPIILLAIPLSYIFLLIPGIKITVDPTMSVYFSILKSKAEKIGIPYEILLVSTIVGTIINPFFNTIFAFGEEAGWRGFLLTRLEEELGKWPAIIISGIIWGIWHWPLILLFGYDYPNTPSELWMFCSVIFLLFTVGIGIFLSWLKFKSDSVILPALAHGSINANLGFGLFIIITDSMLGFPAGIIPSISAIIIGILVFYLEKVIKSE